MIRPPPVAAIANVVSITQSSSANPKFARFPGKHGCELRVQERHWNRSAASVLSIPKFAQRPRRMLAHFGIGTLTPYSIKTKPAPDKNLGADACRWSLL